MINDIAACRGALRDMAEGLMGMYCSREADAIAALHMTPEALAQCTPFDVAVVDAAMPNLDGIAQCEACRTDHAPAGLRLILDTSLDQAVDAQRAKAAGYAATAAEPLRHTEL